MSQIHGDISLLVYVKTDNNGDKNANVVMSESSAVDNQTMNQDVDVSDIKATGNGTCRIATCSNANRSTGNDELLAGAFSELENENIYKKPVGRSYGKTKNIKTLKLLIQIQIPVILHLLQLETSFFVVIPHMLHLFP